MLHTFQALFHVNSNRYIKNTFTPFPTSSYQTTVTNEVYSMKIKSVIMHPRNAHSHTLLLPKKEMTTEELMENLLKERYICTSNSTWFD
ncbi:hypothetical protein MOSE0_H04038 [Monosporozyma servazzii]